MAGAHEFRVTCELTTSWALRSPEQVVLLSVSINLTYKFSFFLWFAGTEIVTVTAVSK